MHPPHLRTPCAAMVSSSSDSESDSDDCLVYKNVRNVVWSDDEIDEKVGGTGRGRDSDDDDQVCATSSSRKRAKTTATATVPSRVEVVELGDDEPAVQPSAVSNFLAPPPKMNEATTHDVASLHAKLLTQKRMDDLRRAATAPVVSPHIAPEAPRSVGAKSGGTSGGHGGVSEVRGKRLIIVLQPPVGKTTFPFSCRDGETFSKILADFFATKDGAAVRKKNPQLGNPPRLVFDGEVMDQTSTPKDLELEDEDVMDIR